MEKALFLDLDGTLIKTKSGEKYPKNIDDWDIVTGMLPRIKIYKEAGYHICLVSNQGGVQMGYFTETALNDMHNNIAKEIEQYIGRGINYAWCGKADKDHYYRKPNPGMAYQMALSIGLSLRDSYMVGDSKSDEQFAKNAYIGTYLDVKDFLELDRIA